MKNKRKEAAASNDRGGIPRLLRRIEELELDRDELMAWKNEMERRFVHSEKPVSGTEEGQLELPF